MIFVGVVLLIVAGIVGLLLSQAASRRDVAAAKVTASKVVSDMSHQNTAAIRALGNKKFQANRSASQLNTLLTFQTTPPITFSQLYGNTKPVVDRTLVVKNGSGKHVAFVYRYDKLKVPFFVRIDTVKAPGDTTWKLETLSANSNEDSVL